MNFGLKDQSIKLIQDIFIQMNEIDEVIIYGSRAMGNFKESSDIDLTLKGKNLNLQVINRLDNLLDDLLLPYKFDLSIFCQIENKDLVEHINRNGKVFYKNKKYST